MTMTIEEYRDIVAASMTEAALVTNIVHLARQTGWRVTHQRPNVNQSGRWSTATQGHIGWPDLVLVRAGRLVVRECKTERGRVTLDQQAWIDELNAAGVDVGVWRPRDWVAGSIAEALR